MADLNFSVQKLNDFNYETWRFRVQLLLTKEGLNDIVDEEVPDEPDAAWKTRDGKARWLIGLSIDDNQTCHVINARTAREMWQSLQRHHSRSTLATKIFVLRKLIRLQLLEDGNMGEHLAEITNLSNRLASMGDPLKEHLLVAIMLSSLHDSYDGLITALESRPEADLTLEYVKGKLLDEWRKRVEKGGSVGDGEKAFKTGTKPKQLTKKKVCHYCGKEGHFRRDCRKLEADQKSKKTTEVPGTAAEKASNQKANIVVADDKAGEVCLGAGPVPNSGGGGALWFLDSGATSHMTSNASTLENVCPTTTKIGLADGKKIAAAGVGSSRFVSIDGNEKDIVVNLKQVYHVPALTGSLLSVSKLCDEGCSVTFDKTGCQIVKNGSVILVGQRNSNLYYLKPGGQQALLTVTGHNDSCIHMWHRRLGHRDHQAVKKIVQNDLGTGLNLRDCTVKSECGVCYEGKMARFSFPKVSESNSSAVGDLVHTDLCGPIEVATPRGNRYFMTMVDDFSRFCVLYLLQNKSEATEKIIEYTKMLQTQFGKTPKVIRADGGGEYSCARLKKFLSQSGILLQQTAPYSPQQNGTAERKNRSLVEMMRCLLSESGLAKQYWGEAVSTANFLQNIVPTAPISVTPFELWWGKKPNYSFLRVFGSEAYVHVPDAKRRKLDVKARKLIFVGYSEGRKAYRFLDPTTNLVTISRDARFLELVAGEQSEESGSGVQAAPKEVIVTIKQPAPAIEEAELSDEDSDDGDYDSATDSDMFEGYSAEEILRRSARSTRGVPAQRLIEEINCVHAESEEPRNLKEALSCPEKSKWYRAMQEELQSHAVNGTWQLVELPDGRKPIGSKWIYKVKRDASGNVVKHKARLVAQGFTQQYGEDYYEIFAPVTTQATLRTFLAVASRRNFILRHLDVKTAYLYGDLSEELYMKQPPGFAEQGREKLVCKLKRSIYGLKQSARCWNHRLHAVLLQLCFKQSSSDKCLYVKTEGDITTYLLVYVDDLLIGSCDVAQIDRVSGALKREFDITDLGEPRLFLGMEIQRRDGKYSLSLAGYIDKTVSRFGLQEAKTAKSPMDTGYMSTSDLNSPLPNNNEYRSLVGALLYIAVCARPDVAVSASILGRKVCAPTVADWTAAKRVLRFLKATKHQRLEFNAVTDDLVGYSDADWAGDVNTRRSTSGYVFMYAGGAVSWASRLQHCVTLSSMESEYVALGEASVEAVWLRRLLEDLGETVDGPTTIMEDNQSCIHFVQSERTSRRSKHVETKEKYIKELCETGVLQLSYCPTEEMVADIFTKPLGTTKFRKLSGLMGLVD